MAIVSTDKSFSNNQKAWQQIWPAPAKINRFLHIVGRQNDGYHLLQSIFQFVDYCDLLHFSPSTDGSISIKNPIENVNQEDNLVYQAATLLQQKSSTKIGAIIHLEKNIPMGAGLGGGSSDAATTLLALNYLWNCNFSVAQLCQLGLTLGADVPFFVQGKNAFVEGIGEQITAVDIDCPWLLMAVPEIHVSTQDIFSSSKLCRNTPKINLEQLHKLKTSQEHKIQLDNYGRNDCQQLVISQYPLVKQAFDWISRTYKPRLTGTGGCVFSTFPGHQQAKAANHETPPMIASFVKATLEQSPMRTLLNQFKG